MMTSTGRMRPPTADCQPPGSRATLLSYACLSAPSRPQDTDQDAHRYIPAEPGVPRGDTLLPSWHLRRTDLAAATNDSRRCTAARPCRHTRGVSPKGRRPP
jgi:hypothetical protein